MFLFFVIFIATVLVSALLHTGESRGAVAEYCNLECIENKIRDHSICC